jgi:hypothetical protein
MGNTFRVGLAICYIFQAMIRRRPGAWASLRLRRGTRPVILSILTLAIPLLVLVACDLAPGPSNPRGRPTATPLVPLGPVVLEGDEDSGADTTQTPGAPRPTRTRVRTPTVTLTPTVTPGTPIPTSTPTITLTPFATPTRFATFTPLQAPPTVTPPNPTVPATETPTFEPTPPNVEPTPEVPPEVPTETPSETPTLFALPTLVLP